MKKLLSFFIVFSCCVVGSAQAGRPLNTDDIGVVEIKTVEAEFAFSHTSSSDVENELSAVFTTGIADHIDIGVEIPYAYIDPKGEEGRDGVGDIGITTKWHFLRDEDLFDAALSVNYKSDNGNDEKGLGTGSVEYSITAIVTKEFDHVTAHINLGNTIVKDADDLFNFNLAGEFPINDETSFVAEIYGSHTFEGKLDEQSLSGLLGFTHNLGESTVYDFGVGFGISQADPDFTITTGFTVEL